jgi:hypothetical protein
VSARVTLRPVAEGFAIVDVVVSRRAALPGATVEWASMGVRTAIERELTLIAPGGTGQGEVWSASWRWWHERPRLAVGFAAPRVAGLPGVWRVDASWELQTYAVDALATVRESRTHGGITMTDWLNGRLRYTISAGIDSWDHAWNAASLGASIERRALRDRVAASATVATWFPSGPVARFTTIAGDAAFRSSNDLRGWVYRAAGGAQRVGNTAPFALWAGAGDGRARPPLLRAHRLLEDGIVNMESGSVFGRTLAYGTVEAQRWFDHPVLARIAIAGFVDAARATRTHAMDNVAQVDVGGGLRVKLPGWERFLRADIAHGVRDGANAFTLGWMF